MKQRSIAILLFVIGAGAATAAACTSCDGDGGTQDAAADMVKPDARFDAGALDATPDGTDACAALTSDWPGYVRFTAIDPCARVDVPSAPSVLPPASWVACSSGRSSCLEFAHSWPGYMGQYFGSARVGRDSAGIAAKLSVHITRDYAQEETVIYDFNSLAALTSVRYQGNLLTDTVAGLTVAANNAEFLALRMSTNRWYLGGGGLGTLFDAGAIALVPTTVVPSSSGIQFDDVSDTTYAFDTGTTGHVVRVPLGTTSYGLGAVQNVALSKPVVRGDDVFAFANQGSDGWARYYRVDANGAVTDFANKPQHLISGLACDATRLYWIDAYGAAQPNSAQPNTELWSATYSSDWTTASQSATKLVTISGTRGTSVAFNGYFAGLLGVNDIWVARASDSTTWHVTPEPNRRFNSLAYVDDKEVWVVEDLVPDSGAPTLGISFERIVYGP